MTTEEKDNSIVRLVNPEFQFGFMDKVYTIRKATLDKMVAYKEKVASLKVDVSSDEKLVAFCIWIMLKDQIEGLTEEMVLFNTPADVDTLEVLSNLGFINPSKMKAVKEIQNMIQNKLTGRESS